MGYTYVLTHHNPASSFPRAGLGENPTVAELRSYIDGFVHYNVPSGLWFLLGATLLFTVVVVILVLIVLVRRLMARTFWLFRWERGLFIPNTMMCFLLIEGVYVILFAIYTIWWSAVQSTGKLSVKPLGPFWVTVWLPLWMGGFWATWGTLWSIPSDVIGRRGASEKFASPQVYNVAFVAIHVAVFTPAIALAVLFLKDHFRYMNQFDAFHARTALLPDGPASQELIAEGIVVWQGLIDAKFWVCVAEWYWLSVAALHALTYGIVGGRLVGGLSKHINRHLELHREVLSRQVVTAPPPDEAPRQQVFLPPVRALPVPPTRTRAQQLQLARRNVMVHFTSVLGLTIFFMSIALFETLTEQPFHRQPPPRFGDSQIGVNFALAIANAIGAGTVGWALIWKELEPVVFSWQSDGVPQAAAPNPPQAPQMATMLGSAFGGFSEPTTSHTKSTLSGKSGRSTSRSAASTAGEVVPLRTLRLGSVDSLSLNASLSAAPFVDPSTMPARERQPPGEGQEVLHSHEGRPAVRTLHHVESGESFPLDVAEVTPMTTVDGGSL